MILFYILVAGMPLVKQPLFATFVNDLTITKYVGAACVAYAALHLVMRGAMPRAYRSRMSMLLLGFYAVALVSFSTRSLPVLWEMSPILSLTSFVLLYFIVIAVVDTPQRLRWTYLVATVAITVGSLYMVREWKEYHLVYRDFRPGFVVGDANYFTLSALLILPIAFYLMMSRPGWWERLFLAGSLGLTLIAIMLGASRGGFVGLVVEGGFILWHAKHRARGIALAALVLGPLFVFSPSSPLRRLRDPNYSDNKAEQARLVTWSAGGRMFREHPWAGIGLGNFKPMVESYEEPGQHVLNLAHNTYIELAAELGAPGLLFFLALYFTAYGQARKAVAAGGESWMGRSALGLQAGLIGGATGIFFLSAEQQKLLWLMVFLAPCAAALAGAARPVEAPREEPAAAMAAAPAQETLAESLQ